MDAPEDIRTVADWAQFLGVSTSTLAEGCRLVHVRPHDAKDLARVLRALKRVRLDGLQLEAVLDIADRRTLRRLIERANYTGRGFEPLAFLEAQRFVHSRNEGLHSLKDILKRR
jgi:hypothetical protein